MGLLDNAILFAASFCNVFLLGFQSKNVQRSRYFLAAVTSAGITLAQYFFVRYAAHGEGTTFLLVSGLAGVLGILAAIRLHDYMHARQNKPVEPEPVNKPKPSQKLCERPRTLIVAETQDQVESFLEREQGRLGTAYNRLDYWRLTDDPGYALEQITASQNIGDLIIIGDPAIWEYHPELRVAIYSRMTRTARFCRLHGDLSRRIRTPRVRRFGESV